LPRTRSGSGKKRASVCFSPKALRWLTNAQSKTMPSQNKHERLNLLPAEWVVVCFASESAFCSWKTSAKTAVRHNLHLFSAPQNIFLVKICWWNSSVT
jgi:hypothetical protein